MLTPESYQTAWLVYGAASLAALVYLYFLIGDRMSRVGRLSLLLVLAGLVLTPAHPGEDIDSWAPALFVTGFELLTNGAEAAARPVRSLVAAEAIAVAASLCLWVFTRLFLRRARSGS